jgi:hypothetical protein
MIDPTILHCVITLLLNHDPIIPLCSGVGLYSPNVAIHPCAHSFRCLSDGRLFRLENDPALRQSNPTKEYFWLCPECSANGTLCISPEGQVIPIALAGQLFASNFLVTNRQKGLLLNDVTCFAREHIGQKRGSQTDNGTARVAK